MRSVGVFPRVFALVGAIGLSFAACAAHPKQAANAATALTDADKDAFIQLAMRSAGSPRACRR